jgi:hypothetical protein
MNPLAPIGVASPHLLRKPGDVGSDAEPEAGMPYRISQTAPDTRKWLLDKTLLGGLLVDETE